MQLELTWVDALLMVLLAASIVLGVRRGVSMLIVALGSLVVWIVLNILGLFFPPFGFVIALIAGYALGALARTLVNGPLEALSEAALPAMMLGGFGGLLLGLGLIAALILSMPISANTASGGFDYPSTRLPTWIGNGVRDSAVQQFLSQPASRGGLGVWGSNSALRNLLVPDKASR